MSRIHSCILSCFSHVQLFVTLWTVAYQASLSTQAGVGCYALLQGIFPTQGSNPHPLGLLHWLLLLLLSHFSRVRLCVTP